MNAVYPCLSDKDFGFVRIGGSGLANCMFAAARAYVMSRKQNFGFIEPTWRKLSIGPILRREKDKRFYGREFNRFGITGLRKFFLINFKKKNIVTVGGLGRYFVDLIDDYELVKEYFSQITPRSTQEIVDKSNLEGCVAIHVRLGDYSSSLRVPIDWYIGIVKELMAINPEIKFKLFSDGTDDELRALTDIPNVEKVFFGNAYSDMYAMSKCKLVIASDSTFSAWGAFLGKVPLIFNRRHFPSVYSGLVPEFVLGSTITIPEEIKTMI